MTEDTTGGLFDHQDLAESAAVLGIEWPQWFVELYCRLFADDVPRKGGRHGSFLFEGAAAICSMTTEFRNQPSVAEPSSSDPSPTWQVLPQRFVVVGVSSDGYILLDTLLESRVLFRIDTESYRILQFLSLEEMGVSTEAFALDCIRRME